MFQHDDQQGHRHALWPIFGRRPRAVLRDGAGDGLVEPRGAAPLAVAVPAGGGSALRASDRPGEAGGDGDPRCPRRPADTPHLLSADRQPARLADRRAGRASEDHAHRHAGELDGRAGRNPGGASGLARGETIPATLHYRSKTWRAAEIILLRSICMSRPAARRRRCTTTTSSTARH